jgi:hypothetical protein
MGTILTAYGDPAWDHEGYAGQVLDDGTITGTYSNDTTPRMIGTVVAACSCGWAGTTRYPAKELFDTEAEDLALAEWENQHAIPTLEDTRVEQCAELAAGLRALGTAHADQLAGQALAGRSRTEQRALLDRVLAHLDRVADLARGIRDAIPAEPTTTR